MEWAITFIFVLLAVLGVLTLWNITNTRKTRKDDQTLLMINQQLNQVSNQVTNQLNTVMAQVNERLKENVQMLRNANENIGEKLDKTVSTVNAVQNSLGRLSEANKRIYEVGKDISGLQELLRAPTFRGEMGEFLLGDLLGQILPREHFTLQYQFKSGEVVDAVIHLGSYLVPVDSKFPLENFKKMVESSEEKERRVNRKKFVSDVKRRIDDIAEKYILPDEGTFEFALMYIPAENVYYETIIKDESGSEKMSVCTYALSKKVIPTSPNSFYAYLMAILLGLRGLKIEKNVREIIANLGRLHGDLGKFQNDFEIVGKHIYSTKNKYEEAERKLGRLSDKLLSIGEVKSSDELEERSDSNTHPVKE